MRKVKYANTRSLTSTLVRRPSPPPLVFDQYLYVNWRSTRSEGLPEGYFFTFNGQLSVCEFWAPQNEQLAVELAVDESTSLETVAEFSQYIIDEGRAANKATKV